MSLSPHSTLTRFYPSAGSRARFVNDLFDTAAADYDWMTAAMSFGTDRRYRRQALASAGLESGMRVLDVATGTGRMVEAALGLGVAPGRLVGLDPSRGMLANHGKREAVPLFQGLGEDLPFRDGTFDLVVMGYALRHVEDLGRLFSEFYRVVRDRGRVLILEITRPSSRAGFHLLKIYMETLLPLLIRWRGRHPESARLMKYYWATIAECVAPAAILTALEGAGFRDVSRSVSAGILSEYRAVKA